MAAGTGKIADAKLMETEFIPLLWQDKITANVYIRITEKYKRLNLASERTIEKLGDIALFRNRNYRNPFRLPPIKLCADRHIKASYWIDDPVGIQSDLNLLTRHTENMGDTIFRGIPQLSEPSLFCGRVTNIECIRMPNTFGEVLRLLYVYGFKSVSDIRVVTQIISNCKSAGWSSKEIINHLDQMGF